MGAAVLAKKPESPEVQTSGSGKPTTWKCSPKIATILRKIQSYTDENQEDTLDHFEEDFDNYLATLQAEDMAKRKKRLGNS